MRLLRLQAGSLKHRHSGDLRTRPPSWDKSEEKGRHPWTAGSGSRGSILAILVGFLSIMIILVFTISFRKSGHVQLMTNLDQKKIARYFLESLVGDILSQFRGSMNDPKSGVFKSLRNTAAGNFQITLAETGYQPAYLLEALRKDLQIEILPEHKIQVMSLNPLEYPDVLEFPKEFADRSGFLGISCRIRFKDRIYSLRSVYPLKVVMYLTPLLKEFVLYCDQMHLEQTQPFGDRDKINILFTKRSDHPTPLDNPLNVPLPAETMFMGKPWVLFPTLNCQNEKEKNGRIYLGADSKPIYLNLAGEMHFRGMNLDTASEDGQMCDLWMIPPTAFSINSKKEKFVFVPQKKREEGLGTVAPRSLILYHPQNNDRFEICMYGFSAEIDDKPDGNFLDKPLDESIQDDPSFKNLAGDRKRLKLATSLKLYGLNPEEKGEASTYFTAREIFGNVYSRFFQIACWRSGGNPKELIYKTEALSNKGYKPDPIRISGYDSPWEPIHSSDAYSDYMSKVVSGGDLQTKSFDMPMNIEAGVPKVFSFAHFKPTDKSAVKGPFEKFGEEWFSQGKMKIPDQAKKTVLPRISRFFPNQDEFKKFAGIGKSSSRLRIEGVVYVKGPLVLPDITTRDIRGGIVLVDGPITLGNITRSWVSSTDAKSGEDLLHLLDSLKQSEFLTFVSLSGDPITLSGDTHLGVQLISLKPGLGGPVNQISWKEGKMVRMVGGVAVSSLNMVERIREFKKTPLFMFAPCMADAAPERLASLSPERTENEFYVE